MSNRKLLINGKLVDGASTLDVVNPATGEVFETCARADEKQANEAVAAAKAAFPAWSAKSRDERADYLCKLADAMEARMQDFAALLTREQGKPMAQAMFEIGGSIAGLRAYAEMELPTRVLREDDQQKLLERRSPLGVVAAITPWNFPMILLINKVGPGLVTGNTMVIKPAPTTPLTTLELGRLCAEVLPPGVVNVITDQNDLGSVLTSHPDVAKVAFTGSTVTGKKVLKSAADTLKRFTLELGGNDAAIVLDDMDPKEAAVNVFSAAMFNAGQVCLAAKRAYVPRAMFDDFCDELVRLAEQAKVGDGLEDGTQIGPLQNKQQYDKVLGFLTEAKEQGRVLVGGNALDRPGYFIAPTIVRDLPDTATLVCEEQFGPVLPVLPYDNIDEVIERVNDSPYGLGGTVWGKDVERATDVAMRVHSGTVWVNVHLELPFDVPFGGSKQSGIGREQGQAGLEEFTQAHVVIVSKSPAPPKLGRW